MENDHCQRTVHKATKPLNRLQWTMYGCTDRAKAAAYLTLVRQATISIESK